MTGEKLPVVLQQSLPRLVRAHWVSKALLTLLGVTFVGFVLLMLIISYPLAHKQAVLKTSGTSTVGKITGLYTEGGKPPRVYHYGNYEFSVLRPDGTSITIKTNREPILSDIFNSLAVGQSVPVIYDPHDPSAPLLNFADRVHLTDPYKYMIGVLQLVFPALFLFYGFLFSWFLYFFFKEKTSSNGEPRYQPRLSRKKNMGLVGVVAKLLSFINLSMQAGG